MQVLRAGPALPRQTGPSESSHMAQVPLLTFLKLYLGKKKEKKKEIVLRSRTLKLAKGRGPHKTSYFEEDWSESKVQMQISTGNEVLLALTCTEPTEIQRLSWKKTKWAVPCNNLKSHPTKRIKKKTIQYMCMFQNWLLKVKLITLTAV